MNKIALTLATCLLCSCATMEHGSTQPYKILTRNDTDATTTCKASNEEGQWENIKPGEQFTAHRDGNPMQVICENAQQIGTEIDQPEFGGRFLALDLLLDACIISCIIDGSNNAFYDYSGLTIVTLKNK